MKTVWMFNHYAMHPPLATGFRYHSWGNFLVGEGYRVYIFCSAELHGKGINMIKDGLLFTTVDVDDITYVYVKAGSYKGNGIKRIVNMLNYTWSVFKASKYFDKPDLIIARSPNPLACFAGLKLARQYSIPCICDIVDLWPESIVIYKNISRSNPIIKALYMYERWMYKKASALIFSMEGCREYLFERGFKNVIDFSKVFYINMGVDIKLFDSNLVEFIYDDPQLVRKDIFKVVYCGSVRYVNNLKLLCDVAYEIQKSGVSDIYLMIHGGGDQVDNLIQYCIDREISNIKFYGWIEKEKIPYVLAHADLTVLNYNNSPLLRFGGSMNKMFEYFASGKPVLTNVQMGYSLIERYHCGLEVNSDLPEKIADGIMKFYNMSEETREEYGRNSRKAAMDFDVPILCQRLGVVIDYVFQNREEGGV